MANTDDTAKKQPLSHLELFIEAQRKRLLQAHSVMHCLYEVLLYSEGEEAVTYAEAAHLAAMLVDDCIEQLDSTRLRPMIEAIKRTAKPEGYTYPLPEEGPTGGGGDDQVREPRVIYMN